MATVADSAAVQAAWFAAAFLLDIPVAVLLGRLLRPIGPRMAVAATLLRLVYAIAALGFVAVLAITDRLADFEDGFEIVLMIFGAHLAVVGRLLSATARIPRLLGAAVALGGVGYLLTGAARLLGISLPAPLTAALAVPALAELGLAVSLLRNRGWVSPTTR